MIDFNTNDSYEIAKKKKKQRIVVDTIKNINFGRTYLDIVLNINIKSRSYYPRFKYDQSLFAIW